MLGLRVKSLQYKLIFLFMALSLFPLLATSWNNLSSSSALLKSQIQNQLSQVARVKQAALDSHLNSVIQNAKALSDMRAIQTFLTLHAQNRTRSDAQADAFDVIHSYQENHWGLFHHIFIADPTGQVILSPSHGSSTASHLGQNISLSPFFKDALSQTQITDFFGFEETNHYHQLLLHPIKNDSGQVLGVLVFEVFIDHVKSILTDRFELGETGHIFLTSLDGTEVVNNKEDHRSPHQNLGIQAARNQGIVFGEYKNAEGTDILGFYLREPQYPWILAVEIDRDEAYAAVSNQFRNVVIMLLVVMGVIALLGVVLGRRLTQPLVHMAQVADRIAEGDLTPRVSYQSGDEIGTLAGALNRMSDNLRNILKEVLDNSDGLNVTAQELSSVAHQATQNIADMGGKYDEIARSSMDMSTKMKQVSQTAEHSVSNVNTVAAGTEEMTSTITEIAQNAESAREVTLNAVESVEKTSNQVEKLGVSASEISKVIEVIVEIAEQTKLLALNATIEAARAGEAGKGFAVVASEVKDLAQQTNDATEEIRARIGGIQTSTQNTVNEIKQMNDVINKVNEIVVTIASAVEEQSVTTRDIAQNITQASIGIQEMSESVQQATGFSESIAGEMNLVNQASADVESATEQVSTRAERLMEMGNALKEIVHRFRL